MIKITNGQDTLEVTRGAYKAYYSSIGYVEVDGEVAPSPSSELEKTLNSESSQSETDEGGLSEAAGEIIPPEENAENSLTSEPENDEAENSPEELSEIPLGEMTKAQLLAYAEELEVEASEDMTKKEIRAVIRKALN